MTRHARTSASLLLSIAALCAAVGGVQAQSADPEREFIAATYAIQSDEDFVRGAHDACIEATPDNAPMIREAYAQWRKTHAEAFAALPAALERSFAILARNEKRSVEDIRTGFATMREQGKSDMRTGILALDKDEMRGRCGTLADFLAGLTEGKKPVMAGHLAAIRALPAAPADGK